MLKISDFFHLPQLDPYVKQMIAAPSGMILIAGLDARPEQGEQGAAFLPSGRSAIAGILLHEILLAHPYARAVVVSTDRSAAHVSRPLRPRVDLEWAESNEQRPERLAEAIRRRPGLLVIDHLDAASAPLALQAACQGLRVLAQMDTLLTGSQVARQLIEQGASAQDLSGLDWVLGVQRLPVLCPHCKHPFSPQEDLLAALRGRHPALANVLDEAAPLLLQQAAGCERCRFTGRLGDLAVFDVFHAAGLENARRLEAASQLTTQEYLLRLIAQGYFPPGDLLELETNQLRRTYTLLAASEQAYRKTHVALHRKLAELEASNRVLLQRTETLISLQELAQALIDSTGLEELAARLCRRASELCGAGYIALYYQRGGQAEILALRGWPETWLHTRLDIGAVDAVFQSAGQYLAWPPGILPQSELERRKIELQAGVRLVLQAQEQKVGWMIVQSERKKGQGFTPGQLALLQAFANQAAIALQRAGLVEDLKAKIAQLEAAQVELLQKERLEHELQLARQVQQSILPRSFPQVAGFAFAARNEPARQVGGDFYDIFRLDDEHLGVVIADVSDKGMPAALYMTLTRSLLLAEARRERLPRPTLLNVNRLLLELGESRTFVSLFYGILHVPTGRFTYARAGHDRPLLLRRDQVQTLGGSGAVLGVLENDELRLSEEQVDLLPGDRLVLYTDGLTDSRDAAGAGYGLERLKQLLARCAPMPAEALCDAVFAGLQQHQGLADQYDDMTLLVIELKNQQGPL